MTGRQAGYCAGNDRPGYAEPSPGYTGFGRGYGGRHPADRRFFGRLGFGGRGGPGRGGYRWRNWFHATGAPGWARFGPDTDVPSESVPSSEADALRTQAEWLRGELDAIDQRLQELEPKE
jgi:hypothetical protein